MSLYSKVLKSLSKANLYSKFKFFEKLLFADPNIFDCFLFNVVFFGIKFSSLSLRTVATSISKNLFILFNFSFL